MSTALKVKSTKIRLWKYTGDRREAILDSWLNTLGSENYILTETHLILYDARDVVAFKLKFGVMK
jgi:hypothetical protein